MKLTKVHIIVIFFIVLIIVARFYLGIVRYFDPDEFAHLHWAYLMSVGQIPYKDFFIYHIPFFQWILSPLFLLPTSTDILLLARIHIWVSHVGIGLLVYLFTYHLSRSQITGILAVFIFFTFPMTFDKSIEIRPDTDMTLLFLTGTYILLKKTKSNLYWCIAGLSFSISAFIFPKILFAGPATLLLLTRVFLKQKNGFKKLVALVLGITIPTGFFFLYLLVTNTYTIAFEAIVFASQAVNTGKSGFSPLLALSPFPFVYVEKGGVSIPWIINSILFFGAAFGLLHLFFKQAQLALFFLVYFTGAIIFLYLFPLPYLQYFIPLTPFISVLFAYSIYILCIYLKKIHTHIEPILYAAIASVFIFSFFIQYKFRLNPGASNDEQLQVVRDILKISKPNDTVYDMVGSYVFRKDGYYICCHPYQEFVDRLPWKLPTLQESLMQNQTKFIILDRSGQSLWLPKPDDLHFIRTHYVASIYPKIYIRQ